MPAQIRSILMLEDYTVKEWFLCGYIPFIPLHMPLSPSSHARAPAEARVDPSISKLTKLHYVEAPAIQVRMFGSNAVKPKCINIFSKYADPNWDWFSEAV